ncbi:MAG: TIGR04141 family sporadically distributed protein [Acidobacteria bacterium]|nr:TIGR04141 family sporadically distributed protein [Acidobacteriota bacterium]
MRITYYLFKKSVASFDQVWRDGGNAPGGSYVEVPLKETVPFEAEAHLQANKPAAPNWWSFVEPYCAVQPSAPLNRTSSFVLLIKVSGRVFAVTFGHGFAAINRSRLEPDFGLKVTLNSVDPKKLRSVQARNIDPTTVSKQHVVNQDSGLAVFDVDFYHDLLSRLEGVPDDDTFGKRVAGADACYLTGDVAFPALGAKCLQLLKRYGSKSYAKHFSFIDQVRPIRDETLIGVLDGKLADALKRTEVSALGFALPDIAGYERISGYRVSRGHWRRDFEDLNALEILTAYNEEHPDADDHLEVKIAAVTDDGSPVDVFSVRQGAVFQIRYKSRVYVLTLNKWYEVHPEYAQHVDAEIDQLPVIKAKGFLPTLSKGTSEGDYNAAASASKGMVLMDKRVVQPKGAASTIEVCDLFTAKGEFVHVKKHTRSATLSHLLAQGTVSARLFVDDKGYRETFRKALPAALQTLVDPDKVEPSKHSVVYAISAPASKAVPSGLPFFTKVNLLFHSRELQRMGLTPRLFHIHEV